MSKRKYMLSIAQYLPKNLSSVFSTMIPCSICYVRTLVNGTRDVNLKNSNISGHKEICSFKEYMAKSAPRSYLASLFFIVLYTTSTSYLLFQINSQYKVNMYMYLYLFYVLSDKIMKNIFQFRQYTFLSCCLFRLQTDVQCNVFY